MTEVNTANTLTVIGIGVALLVGTGALTFFAKYGTRLAFAERDSKEALATSKLNGDTIIASRERIALMEESLKDIKNSLHKLDLVESIKTTLDSLKDRFDDVVPRREHTAYMNQNDRMLDEMKAEIKSIKSNVE